MTDHSELVDIEQRGWVAHSTTGEAGPFYDGVLVEHPLMLLPGGMVLDDRAAIVESMSGAPWDRYELEDMRTVSPGDGAAVVAYGGVADRGDTHVSSLFSSTYVRRDGAWRMPCTSRPPAEAGPTGSLHRPRGHSG